MCKALYVSCIANALLSTLRVKRMRVWPAPFCCARWENLLLDKKPSKWEAQIQGGIVLRSVQEVEKQASWALWLSVTSREGPALPWGAWPSAPAPGPRSK